MMDTKSNLLFEESLGLCSSFDSESDTSLFETTPLSFNCIGNNTNNEDTIFKSLKSFHFADKLSYSSEMDYLGSDNVKNHFSQNNYSDFGSVCNTSENRSVSIVKMFDCLSLNDGPFQSTTKIKELKCILSEANNAYVNLLTSQFVLNSYKVIKQQVSPGIASKIEEALTGSVVEKLPVLKSKKGETYSLLGLEKDHICIASNGTLSSTEKVSLSKQAVTVLESNVQQLSSQQRILKGIFGAHCQKVMRPDSLLCEEREKLAQLHSYVQNQLDQACQLLVSTSQLVQQLAHMLQTSEQELALATFTSLRDKATHMKTTTGVLWLKMEARLYKDKNQTKASNGLGSELKTSVDALAEELKSLQKALAEYEKKEESSRRYRELVADYAKTKRQLHHKYQTLKLLNDPDISFT